MYSNYSNHLYLFDLLSCNVIFELPHASKTINHTQLLSIIYKNIRETIIRD